MKKLLIVTLIVTAAFTAGCNNKKSNIEMLTAHEWSLDEVTFANSDFSETPPPGVSIIFSDTTDRVAGSGGCNRFFGSYTATEEGKITMGPLGSTLMECPTVEFEAKYFAWLEEADQFSVDENGLRLLISENGTTLVYKPVLKAVTE